MSNIGPASHGTDITPNDDNPLDKITRGIWVGSGGNIRVTLFSGEEVTLKAVPSGTLLPISAIKVWATDTSASDLVGLW